MYIFSKAHSKAWHAAKSKEERTGAIIGTVLGCLVGVSGLLLITLTTYELTKAIVVSDPEIRKQLP